MGLGWCYALCLVVAGCAIADAEDPVEPKVFSISPHEGSYRGGTRLYIRGQGFSSSANLNSDPNAKLGNKAYLLSDSETVPCDVENDASHETMIVCYTRPMRENRHYYIQVEVDGIMVPFEKNCNNYGRRWTCRFIPRWWRTPYIRSCTKVEDGENRAVQTAHAPGALITCSGRIYTQIFGSHNQINENGRTVSIRRVYFGGKTCDLLKEQDEFYGLRLTSGDEGTFTCKTKGTYVGFQNVSLILTDEYGRSDMKHEVFRASGKDVVYNFQTYAEITGVTPQSGSLEGGTRLVIEGRNFDDTTEPVRILVGGEPCAVVDGTLKSDRVECISRKPGEPREYYTGSRGVKLEVWNATTIDNAEVPDLLTNASDYEGPVYLDSASYKWQIEKQFFVAKLSSVFVAPKKDRYKFAIRSDDQSTLYIKCDGTTNNLTKVAWTTQAIHTFKFASQTSDWIELEKDQQCYFVSPLREGNGEAYIYVAVIRASTTLTSAQAFDAKDEIQRIDFTASFLREKQNITFNNWESQAGLDEVQNITVEHACIDGGDCDHIAFRLIYLGVKTLILRPSDPASKVRDYLKHIAALSDENIAVSAATSGQTRTYLVTFREKRGDYPLLSYEKYPPDVAGLTISISEKTKGVSQLETFKLHFADRMTGAIAQDADAEAIQRALDRTRSAYCPPFLLPDRRLRGVVTTRDYETTKYGDEWGYRLTNEIPFCGTTSLKNPDHVYYAGRTADEEDERHKAFDADVNKWLCLAHRGLMNQWVWLSGSFEGATGTDISGQHHFANPLASLAHETEWRYSCIDLMQVIQSRSDFLHVDKVEISVIKFARVDNEHDYYIDALTIGTEKVLQEDLEGVPGLRTPPALANGQTVEGITVTKPREDEPTYNVEIETHKCGHEIPLVTVAYVPVSDSSSNSVTQREAAWDANTSYISQRIRAGVQPMSGSFDLTVRVSDDEAYNVTDIPVEIPADEFEERLENEVPGFGQAQVIRTGSCHARDYDIHWVSNGGDKPQMEVRMHNVVGHHDIRAKVTTKQEGGILHNPVTGDMLRLPYDTPQVEVFINGLPSRCDGNCEFTTSEEQTPVISSISPTTGSSHAATSITVSGTNLDGLDGYLSAVTIGAAPCSITSHSATSIVCTLGDGPLGTFDVKVNAGGKGYAKKESESVSLAFTVTGGVDSVSPATGFNTGGTEVTVDGYGFTESTTFKFDGKEATVLSVAPTSAVCRTPAASLGRTSVSLVVEAGTETLGTVGFTYTTPDAQVTSVSPVTSTVVGGENLTISGTNLGSSKEDVKVFLGDEHVCEITHWSATQIICKLPKAQPGVYPPRVVTEGGYADTSTHSIPMITYALEVTAVSTDTCSINGGAVVIITGQGFTDSNTTEVKFGHTKCDPVSVSATQIECVMERFTTNHLVMNDGDHPIIQNVPENGEIEYGYGFSWDPISLDVNGGDSVTWKWNIEAAPGSPYGVIVYSTATSTNDTYDEETFRSSTEKTRRGQFTYAFDEEGIYYISTSRVDHLKWGNIVMRMVVYVTGAQSHRHELSLTVDDYEAKYTKTSRKKRSATCSGTVDLVPGCTPPSIADDPNTFSIVSSPCYTPTITSIHPTNGTMGDTVTITGSGFGTDKCASNVVIADGYEDEYQCEVLTSTSSSITCTPRPEPTTSINVAYYVKVHVDNIGDSRTQIRQDADRRFTLLPSVSELTPTTGSLVGGTLINITGAGFSSVPSEMMVTLNGYSCAVQSTSYYLIQCLTPSSSSAVTRGVVVTRNGQEAKCTGTCEFEYAAAATPTVTAISRTTVDEPDAEIVFVGTAFGDDAGKVDVTFGGHDCPVTSSNSTTIRCEIAALPAGTHATLISIQGKGRAKLQGVPGNIVSPAVITSMSAVNGSTAGGLPVTFTGNGFAADEMLVEMGNSECLIKFDTRTNFQFQCVTPAKSSLKDVTVTGGGLTFTSTEALKFHFKTSLTPTISAIDPAEGAGGDEVTITGTMFNPGGMTVSVGSAACVNITGNQTTVGCTLGDHAGGAYLVAANVNEVGLAESSVSFRYSFGIDVVAPASGSFGGGDLLTINGRGFGDNTEILVCNTSCLHGEEYPGTSVEKNRIVCKLSRVSTTAFDEDKVCDVTVSVDGQSVVGNSLYTFAADMTPIIANVNPVRGGTQGGTRITVTGTGFSSDHTKVSVSIGGVACDVTSSSETEIECTTGARGKSHRDEVGVTIEGKGDAASVVEYHYVDVWSSNYTWGGTRPPVEGDFVVVPEGQHLMIDVDTPVLKMLLIQGGTVEFDEKDIHLQAENILITDGGVFQIGTAENPFEHKAVVTMHGHLRTRELPIYGAKSIGVRNGTLDLHGKHVPIPWTLLSSTARKDSDTLMLKHAVTWKAGDEIVIASTGDRHSQRETEKAVIKTVSGDGMTLTLKNPLLYTHISATENFGDFTLETHAEVGLLTRNIVIEGSKHVEWAKDKIPECEAGFDTGEFATQTCFQGRFGEEEGSDQFGAQIMIHHRSPGLDIARARLEYVELRHVGQAFRLGRYPIHFHLLGDVGFNNYVRGCSIHQSFNRAVTIHNTHHLLVEHNVIYDIMGGAVFIEDGIEHGNLIQYNLVLFSKQSTSLQNDDITPAAFWVTNPNNTLQHNHAAGGSHFGFWYRIREHPDGPSADDNICQQLHPVEKFNNNTVHSQGWFGLWIFQKYTPRGDGSCGSEVPSPASFSNLNAWNCQKGVELVNVGAVQIHNSILAHNSEAGAEAKLVTDKEVEWGQVGLYGSYVIAHANKTFAEGTVGSTALGVVLPFTAVFEVKNTTFINFDEDGTAAIGVTSIDGKCTVKCGGWEARFSNISFKNSPNKAKFRWEHEVVLRDLDGTLSGNGEPSVIVPYNPTISSAACPPIAGFDVGSPAGVVCDGSAKFHRVAWNNAKPVSLEAKDVSLTNQHGTSVINYLKKRLTHKFGWMTTLMDGGTYQWTFTDAEHLTNISYEAGFYDFEENDCVIIAHNLTQKPDRFFITGEKDEASHGPLAEKPDCKKDFNGDYYFDGNSKTLYYLVSGRDRPSPTPGSKDRDVNFRVYRCYYENCTAPPDQNGLPPVRQRPEEYALWHLKKSWRLNDENEYLGVMTSDEASGIPPNNQVVRIDKGTWMVINQDFPTIDKLWIEGTLEIDWQENLKFTLSATHVIVLGGRLIAGWEDQFFQGSLSIVLRGNVNTQDVLINGGLNLGAKSIGVVGGGLDLHGANKDFPVTHLANSLSAGQNSITLVDTPSLWSVGDDIAIATTSMDPWETETFKILSMFGNVLTLNESAKYEHMAETFSYQDGAGVEKTYDIRAEVSVLTRNIKIIAEETDDLLDDSFGARVLIAGVGDVRSYGRIQNVEFSQTGQEGFVSDYDPRCSLAFLNTGVVDAVRPSFVTRNTFHNGFNMGVCVFGATGLEVKGNVLHHTVGPAIRVVADSITLAENLAMLVRTRSAYGNREELDIVKWMAGMEVNEASRTRLVENVVAGSERAGYRIDGHICDPDSVDEVVEWGHNTVRAALQGVWMNKDGFRSCTTISKFRIHSTYDYGVYYQGRGSVEMYDLLITDSNLAIMPLVYAPPATSHISLDKVSALSDSTVVAVSKPGYCPTLSANADFVRNSGLSRGTRRDPNDKLARTGLVFPSFSSTHNKAPSKTFSGSTSYPAIGGRQLVTNVSFVNFGDSSCSSKHTVFMTNLKVEDFLHPIIAKGLNFDNSPLDTRVFYHRPSLKKINPSDCVDMECDGMKKALLIDLDGTTLGSRGSVIPESEFEWDGDPRRGLGDYRIPKTLLTRLNGSRIPVSEIAPYKGILRANTSTTNCTMNYAWRGYKCHGYHHGILVAESLDADTETRRISPVAFLTEKHVDLNNGPQDHGWCAGYTCQERLSTFWTIVAFQKIYEMHFTGTAPQKLRLRILNENGDTKLVVKIFYTRPQRLDVYLDGKYQSPNNEGVVDGNNVVLPPRDDSPDEYKPTLASESGENYFDRDASIIYVLVTGEGPVDIVEAPVVVITFRMPAVSPDEFFDNGRLVMNLALFLNIPASKIRLVNAVREGVTGRRKRDTGSYEATVELGDPPAESIEVLAHTPTGSALNATTPPGPTTQSALDQGLEELEAAVAKITNALQDGSIIAVLGTGVTSIVVVDRREDSVHDPNNTDVSGTIIDTKSEYFIPAGLRIIQQPSDGNAKSDFDPEIQVTGIDADGNDIILGRSSDKWQATVTIQNGPADANLVGTTIASFENGVATFENLTASLEGSYTLTITVTYPEGLDHLSVVTDPFTLETAVQTQATTTAVKVDTGSGNLPYIIAGSVIGAIVLIALVVLFILKGPFSNKRGSHKIADSKIDLKQLDGTYKEKRTPYNRSSPPPSYDGPESQHPHAVMDEKNPPPYGNVYENPNFSRK